MTDPYAPQPPQQQHVRNHPGYRPLASRIVTFVCGGIAAFILVNLAFIVLGANMGNPLVSFINGVATFFAWPFHDIFTTSNEATRALLNHGLAALAYLLLGAGLRSLFRRH